MADENKKKIARIFLRDRLAGKKKLVIPGTGRSMYPLILENDLLTIQGLADGEIRTGDVILFKTSSGLFCHRVVSRTRIGNVPHLVEIGDRLCIPHLVPAEKVLGKVVKIENDRSAIDLTGFFMRRVNRVLGLYHRMLLTIFSPFERLGAQGPVPMCRLARWSLYHQVKRMSLWPPKLLLRLLIPIVKRAKR